MTTEVALWFHRDLFSDVISARFNFNINVANTNQRSLVDICFDVFFIWRYRVGNLNANLLLI